MVLGVRGREIRRKYHDPLGYKTFALQMMRTQTFSDNIFQAYYF